MGDTHSPLIVRLFNESAPSPSKALDHFSVVEYLQQGFGTEIFKSVPPFNALPLNYQEFLQNIQDLPAPEKMALIHDFVVGQMKYKLGLDESQMRTVSDIIKNPIGDCDDYAQLTMGMLYLAGFNPDKVYNVSGDYSLNTGGTSKDTVHAVAALEYEGQVYVFDMNVMRPFVLDGSGEQNVDVRFLRGSSVTIPGSWSMKPWAVFSSENYVWTTPDYDAYRQASAEDTLTREDPALTVTPK